MREAVHWAVGNAYLQNVFTREVSADIRVRKQHTRTEPKEGKDHRGQ
jgi:hypothetical protein